MLPIDAIGLGAALAPVDFDARRVHHVVLDTHATQLPVQPEPVVSRLVTAEHPRGCGQTLLRLGLRFAQLEQLAREHRRLPALGAIEKRPASSRVAQLHGHVQHRFNYVFFPFTGR